MQAGVGPQLADNNVTGSRIDKIEFFNASGSEFTGKISFDFLQLGTPSTNNGAVLTDTTFYAPFDGQRMQGNGLEGIAFDNNGKIGVLPK